MSRRVIFGSVYTLMLFDFIDRQILVAMFPYLKAEWRLSDAELGSLATVVSLTIGAGAIPISLLAVRWNRLRVLGVMSGAWSIATLAGAAATGFWQLVVARIAVGVAQAGYVPVAGPLLADHSQARSLSTTFGALLSTSIFGSVLGVWLGGWLAFRFGWRAGLAMAGGVSMLLALMLFLPREPLPPRVAPSVVRPLPAGANVLSRTMLLIYAGYTVLSMVAGTVVAWLPSFFHRSYDLPTDRAGLLAAIAMASSGLGVLLLAWMADRWVVLEQRRRLLAAATCALTSSMLLTTAFSLEPGRLQCLAIVGAAFLMLGHVGPILAVVTNLSAPAHRSASLAILIAFQNLVGVASGPLIAGWLSDHFGLGIALQLVCAVGVLGAMLIALAALSRPGAA